MKKRILSFLLALVMVAGLLPATALTAFAAQYTVVGVSVQSDGVVCDDGWYYLDDPSIHLLYSDNSSTFASTISPLYTDEECLDYLTSAPVLGEIYYFKVFAYAYNDTDYSVKNSKSSIDVEGFCSGRVEDAYKDGAVYIVTCSIIYGELTGGVKAVASGVEYDSAKGGYAPNFTTLKAVSTEGKELEHTMVDGKYSYYEAKSGCLYKTNSTTSFSDMLTTEPQEGETYYSYFRLDSIDGNLNIEEDLVDIQIPGYEVEYLASYERDMGFTSLVVYSVTKTADARVYVGGVGMYDGDYLAVGATATQTTKPSGGYAYYEDGTLTLNNYSYEGKGYRFESPDYYATIYYADQDLTLELVGTNTLTQTASKCYGIRPGSYGSRENLTIQGDGSLNVTSTYSGIFVGGSITVNGGTIISTATYGITSPSIGIYSGGESAIINSGSVTASGDYGLWLRLGGEINGGTVTATGIEQAIHYSTSFTVAEGMKIQASTTADGELGEYVAENHDSYKKIVVRSAPNVYVGGVGMYDGDYLAVGATATQTTKPSGGYAYYEDGKLTLNNYSYEGEGYQYNSKLHYYAVIYSKNNDLTLELIGNNTLNQTYLESDMIVVYGANLTVGGDGKLTGTAGGFALYADEDITINGGTVEVSTGYSCIRSSGDVIINDGDITAESENYAAIFSDYDVTVNGGNVTATGGNWAIDYSTGFTVAEGLTIQASTTVDGTLGEYVAANYKTYKKIVIKTPDIYVGGVGMCDGDYLAVGATATRTTKPSVGYAYYKNGTLTLNNYSYEGKGYKYRGYYYAVIYSKIDLTLELIGNNTLTQTYSASDMINVNGANLTVGGDGKLTGTSGSFALYADKGITINGGTIEVSTYYACISSYGGEVIINGGDITAESDTLDAIFSNYDITINGGNVTAIGGRKAIGCGSSKIFSVAEGMNIQASTTVDGELGEYVAANNNSYKKIVIKPDASNITVNCIGDIDYTVSGNVVTVDHEVACKVGYLDGTAYKAIAAVANGNGTYSFTAPAGVTEVLLVVKGDVSGDGRINVGDTAKTYSHVRGTAKLTDPIAVFAADVTGDSKINVGDTAKIYSHVKGTSKLTW